VPAPVPITEQLFAFAPWPERAEQAESLLFTLQKLPVPDMEQVKSVPLPAPVLVEHKVALLIALQTDPELLPVTLHTSAVDAEAEQNWGWGVLLSTEQPAVVALLTEHDSPTPSIVEQLSSKPPLVITDVNAGGAPCARATRPISAMCSNPRDGAA
jgi:hypothetical protein